MIIQKFLQAAAMLACAAAKAISGFCPDQVRSVTRCVSKGITGDCYCD
jgi:hypothetical protein